jgi:hypothetical protein
MSIPNEPVNISRHEHGKLQLAALLILTLLAAPGG